jgi:hypothetical protein
MEYTHVVTDAQTGQVTITPFTQAEIDAITPSISAAKLGKVEEVKAMRDLLTVTGGHKIGANWYHSNEISLIQQIALDGIAKQMSAAGVADSAAVMPTPWKTLGGSFVTLTVGIAKNFVLSALYQQGALFSAAQAKISAIEALTTVADVNAYDVKADWPEVFIP